jgi:hypothetical protein
MSALSMFPMTVQLLIAMVAHAINERMGRPLSLAVIGHVEAHFAGHIEDARRGLQTRAALRGRRFVPHVDGVAPWRGAHDPLAESRPSP